MKRWKGRLVALFTLAVTVALAAYNAGIHWDRAGIR